MTEADEWPLVSVVIPTRARPELLRRALGSVLGQQYAGQIECVVIHDGEDPRPGEALHAGGRRVVALRNHRATGAAGARNCGILAARGKFVALCDDDDIWLPHKLKSQIELLATDPSAVGVGGGFLLRHGDRTTVKRPSEARITHKHLLRSRMADVHPSTLVMRRDFILDGIGLLDEEVPGSYGEDYDWLLRATKLGDLLVLRHPVAEVLWHSGSFFTGQWETITRAIQYLLAKHPDLRTDPKGLARLYGRLAFAQAALGNRGEARRLALACLREHPRQGRAYVALAVGAGAVTPALAIRFANSRGRGL